MAKNQLKGPYYAQIYLYTSLNSYFLLCGLPGSEKNHFDVLKYQLPAKKEDIMIIWTAFWSKANENMYAVKTHKT